MKKTLSIAVSLAVLVSACSTVKKSSPAPVPPKTALETLPFVIYPNGIATNNLRRMTNCPGDYRWSATYARSIANGWGWAPDTNAIFITVSITNRTDTHTFYLGKFGDNGCGAQNTQITSPTSSPAYRFTVYGTNNPPASTNDLPLYMNHWLP